MILFSNEANRTKLQLMQADFDHLCSQFHESRADTGPQCFSSSGSSPDALKTFAPPDHKDLSQGKDDDDLINEQLQELFSLWDSRLTTVTTRPESRVSSSASTVIHLETNDDISFLPAPRRYHPTVWKAWARHFTSMAVKSVRR